MSISGICSMHVPSNLLNSHNSSTLNFQKQLKGRLDFHRNDLRKVICILLITFTYLLRQIRYKVSNLLVDVHKALIKYKCQYILSYSFQIGQSKQTQHYTLIRYLVCSEYIVIALEFCDI